MCVGAIQRFERVWEQLNRPHPSVYLALRIRSTERRTVSRAFHRLWNKSSCGHHLAVVVLPPAQGATVRLAGPRGTVANV